MRRTQTWRGLGRGRAPSALIGLVAALGAAGLLPAAHAAASEIDLEFASKRPGTPTAMSLYIHYTQPDDPAAKPPAIRRIVIDAPRGVRFDHQGVPACEASDAELMAQGPGACPSESRIGGGTITVISGFGPPFDPLHSPTPVFNDGEGWLEVSQDPSSQATIAVTRLGVQGRRISGDIAAAPGGPPDGQSAVRTVDLDFPAAGGYVTTPGSCPASRRWVTFGHFRFGDGTTQTARGSTPCIPAASGPSGRCGRHLAGTPRRDRLSGGSGRQLLRGFGGADALKGGEGRDCLHGGRGRDTLRGDAGADRLGGGPGRDILRGGGGPDKIRAHDGDRDLVRCGAGPDRVWADAADRVEGCEAVTRRRRNPQLRAG